MVLSGTAPSISADTWERITTAARELGYRARPYREGLADALAWFAHNGYLK